MICDDLLCSNYYNQGVATGREVTMAAFVDVSSDAAVVSVISVSVILDRLKVACNRQMVH